MTTTEIYPEGTRLERYKDFLLPVYDIAYVEYRHPNKDAILRDDVEGGTFVCIRIQNGIGTTKDIRISKGNVLSDFHKWYAKMLEPPKTVPINEFTHGGSSNTEGGISDWEWRCVPKGECPYKWFPKTECIPLNHKENKPVDFPKEWTSGYVQTIDGGFHVVNNTVATNDGDNCDNAAGPKN